MELTPEQTYGWYAGNLFVVMKTQKHLLKMYNGFGCSEHRLREMIKLGKKLCIVLFLPDEKDLIRYETTPEKWLVEGHRWENKGDVQRVLPISEFDLG